MWFKKVSVCTSNASCWYVLRLMDFTGITMVLFDMSTLSGCTITNITHKYNWDAKNLSLEKTFLYLIPQHSSHSSPLHSYSFPPPPPQSVPPNLLLAFLSPSSPFLSSQLPLTLKLRGRHCRLEERERGRTVSTSLVILIMEGTYLHYGRTVGLASS